MVKLRGAGPAGALRWKVTARFSLDTGAKEQLRCVRVRHGVGPTHYFTQERFDELFEPEGEL